MSTTRRCADMFEKARNNAALAGASTEASETAVEGSFAEMTAAPLNRYVRKKLDREARLGRGAREAGGPARRSAGFTPLIGALSKNILQNM